MEVFDARDNASGEPVIQRQEIFVVGAIFGRVRGGASGTVAVRAVENVRPPEST